MQRRLTPQCSPKAAAAAKRAASRASRVPGQPEKGLATRGGRSFLEQRAVTPRTKQYYHPLLTKFWAFSKELGEVTSDELLDLHLTDFADHSYFEGQPASMGQKLRAAIADWHPRFSKHGRASLPRFGRALQGWSRLAPGRSRAPLPWLHLVLVCMVLLTGRLREEALFMLTVFACYFRPGEALKILCKDVLAPTPTCPQVAIQLHPEERGLPSKTGVFDDGVAVDPQYAPQLGKLLLQHAAGRDPDMPLFNLKYTHLRATLQDAFEILNLSDPSLYRLRHGGASFDRAMRFRSLPEVKKRGRWVSDASLRRYEKAVRVQKVEAEASPEFLSFAASVAPDLCKFIRGSSSLPRCPWR